MEIITEFSEDGKEAIRDIAKQVFKTKNIACCFCDKKMGALIRLYQGWCCAKCFKEVILKEKENEMQTRENSN